MTPGCRGWENSRFRERGWQGGRRSRTSRAEGRPSGSAVSKSCTSRRSGADTARRAGHRRRRPTPPACPSAARTDRPQAVEVASERRRRLPRSLRPSRLFRCPAGGVEGGEGVRVRRGPHFCSREVQPHLGGTAEDGAGEESGVRQAEPVRRRQQAGELVRSRVTSAADSDPTCVTCCAGCPAPASPGQRKAGCVRAPLAEEEGVGVLQEGSGGRRLLRYGQRSLSAAAASDAQLDVFDRLAADDLGAIGNPVGAAPSGVSSW